MILIEKNGTIKQMNAKDLTKDTIYKKCGLKSDCDFEKRTTWNTTIKGEKCTVELWAKDTGKAGSENKYELPEPVDKILYFGTMAIVRINSSGNIIDIKADLWSKIYDKLMGEFDDLEEDEEEDEDEEDELETVSKSMKTKSGYLKDGFVVDSNSEDEEGEGEDNEDDEEDDDEDDEDDEEDEDEEDVDLEDECSEGSELEEESYEYSDEDD